MSEPLYNVLLTGDLVAGADRAQVVAAFARRFSLPQEKAESLICGRQVIISKGVDAANARRICEQLRIMGAVGAAQLATPAAPPPPAAPAPVPQRAPAPPPPVAAPPPPPAPVPPPASPRPPPLPVQPPQPPQPGLSFRIEGEPDFAFLTVQIPAGETLKVEASAMATMDTHVSMKTKLGGGLSRFVTGESIFINEFTAEGARGEIGIAPGAPGDLRHVYLQGQTIFLQNSGYVASTLGVVVESKWQGFTRGFFSGESLFLIRCSGQGDLWFASYGGIIEVDVDGDYVVDTGNIVAFTDGLEYRITKVGGYKSLFFSGEGLVCRFSGRGRVWVQTRKVGAFASWTLPYRRVARQG
ncbi:TIGR00266 family protein [Solimonas sp. K1W22B-7]|uniref:TIGR00266 family protein n=1 Tax=Solimonas sp. K1W22B-7 TaxID=2303331 RepID=UPI000E32D4E8|nr:TIGR00266 family protein [Solimonas sp. K1W22B-7]AXQ29815.1 TIGR00266 family protein [Solimonas sp. K1W22B-7]